MDAVLTWKIQFVAFTLLASSYCLFLVWNYYLSQSSVICKFDPFAPWTKNYILAIVGAGCGTSAQLWFRTAVSLLGFSDGSLRHPYATVLMVAISSLQAFAQGCHYLQVIPFTCVDFLSVKTTPFLWLEWICTVPFMFFLTSIMDVKRSHIKLSDLAIQVIAAGSMIFLFVGQFPIPKLFSWASFIIANICMVVALAWQQYDAFDEYILASEEFQALCRKEPGQEFIPREVHDRLRVSQCKMNAALFMSLFFTVFPLLYYLRFFGYLDDDTFIVLTYLFSFLSKVLFVQIIGDSHVEILDPNKFLLVEERKKAEESRLVFLRYVFHEVRVPLNSVALGLQLLQESTHLSEQDHDTVSMMREATGFMAETLNDVLSLQKIEEGMLQLEFKPFAPYSLVKAVLSNFRYFVVLIEYFLLLIHELHNL